LSGELNFLQSEKDPLLKKLRFVAWLDERLRQKGKPRPVLVGGLAVEVFSGGNYSTVDIDLVFPDNSQVDALLIPEGFARKGRYWENTDLDLIVECPGSVFLHKKDEIELDDGKKFLITSLEEIIIDRLNACVHWQSRSDCEIVEVLLATKVKNIDYEYLKKRAIEEGAGDMLNQILGDRKEIGPCL
jgi:hypothetical protein